MGTNAESAAENMKLLFNLPIIFILNRLTTLEWYMIYPLNWSLPIIVIVLYLSLKVDVICFEHKCNYAFKIGVSTSNCDLTTKLVVKSHIKLSQSIEAKDRKFSIQEPLWAYNNWAVVSRCWNDDRNIHVLCIAYIFHLEWIMHLGMVYDLLLN